MSPTHHVVVIGAGPAGLSTALSLRDRGRRPVVVEKSGQVAAAWRGRYDRLKLNTGRQFSQLPGRPYPKGTPAFPTRDQVIAHLERHSCEDGIDLRLNTEVVRIDARPDGWWSSDDVAGGADAAEHHVAQRARRASGRRDRQPALSRPAAIRGRDQPHRPPAGHRRPHRVRPAHSGGGAVHAAEATTCRSFAGRSGRDRRDSGRIHRGSRGGWPGGSANRGTSTRAPGQGPESGYRGAPRTRRCLRPRSTLSAKP